jgi:CheY-like chemotaxis protein
MLPNDGKFVLIVEDDISSVEVLGQYLEFLNVKYFVLADGSHILDVIKGFPRVDVIFLDLDLASQNGYEVFKTIRSDTKWNQIPVVVYTSHTDQKSQARQAGFHSFLGKPLNSKAFPMQLQNILSNEPVWD